MMYTILRPVAFLENFAPNFLSKLFTTAWRESLGDVPLQFVSTTDIGVIASKALLSPGQFRNREIGLAGDDLNYSEASQVFKERLGYDMPTTYAFLANAFLWMVKDMNDMMVCLLL